MVSLACITSMCSVQCFPGGHSLRLAFGSFFYPHPSPLYSSTDKSLWQVPGSIGMGAQGWRAQVCHPWRCTFELCLGAGCAIGGSPWTSRTPTSTSDTVVGDQGTEIYAKFPCFDDILVPLEESCSVWCDSYHAGNETWLVTYFWAVLY